MKSKGPLFWALALVAMLSIATLNGCGIWDEITGETEEVTIKGETGASCSLDSECRSNSCVYPGVCQ